MKITFKTTTYEGCFGEEYESHIVEKDGKRMFSGSEGVEPEDAVFYRDLPDPFDCETLLKEVVEHVKNGGDVEFEHVCVKEEDD